MDGLFGTPLRGPTCGPKTRTFAAQRWMGLVDPPTRRARVGSASHQLPCAALDRSSSAPLRRPDRLRFSSRATSLRWTSPIDPPTQMFSNVFSGRVCARPLDGPFGTPPTGFVPAVKKLGGPRGLRWTVTRDPPYADPPSYAYSLTGASKQMCDRYFPPNLCLPFLLLFFLKRAAKLRRGL